MATLAGDNKIVCCGKGPGDGLMKCKGAGVSSAIKWAGKSHPAAYANKQNSGGVDYHDQLGVLAAQVF